MVAAGGLREVGEDVDAAELGDGAVDAFGRVTVRGDRHRRDGRARGGERGDGGRAQAAPSASTTAMRIPVERRHVPIRLPHARTRS